MEILITRTNSNHPKDSDGNLGEAKCELFEEDEEQAFWIWAEKHRKSSN